MKKTFCEFRSQSIFIKMQRVLHEKRPILSYLSDPNFGFSIFDDITSLCVIEYSTHFWSKMMKKDKKMKIVKIFVSKSDAKNRKLRFESPDLGELFETISLFDKNF